MRFHSNLCDSCHDLLHKVCILIITIVPVKVNSDRIHFWAMIKEVVITLMKTVNLKERKKK